MSHQLYTDQAFDDKNGFSLLACALSQLTISAEDYLKRHTAITIRSAKTAVSLFYA